jgi:hypothetical protein
MMSYEIGARCKITAKTQTICLLDLSESLQFCDEDWGSVLLRNGGKDLPEYTSSYPPEY